jgi:hypothetical protein
MSDVHASATENLIDSRELELPPLLRHWSIDDGREMSVLGDRANPPSSGTAIGLWLQDRTTAFVGVNGRLTGSH